MVADWSHQNDGPAHGRQAETIWEVPLSSACAACDARNRKTGVAAKLSGLLGGLALLAAAGGSQAQDSTGGQAAANSSAPAAKIAVELNKLDTQATSCRAYLVIDNQSDKAYDVFKLDLVLFQTDGIIGRRFALDLAPIKSKKRSVKLFDLDGVKCETIGSFLINDTIECKAGGVDESACLDRLTLSTRSNVQLSK
jgi:hypothetical protein